ncbi:MAG: response regulator transcription factor [Chloroflexi bacterium]|nr:response regulator transcription factor [Chloroflexota bacterium]
MMKHFRILLVDDEERLLSFLKLKLKALNYEVATAGNGAEALELVRAQEPNLLVLDLMMPVMDGFETLRQLRTFSTTPVIILSARDSDVDKLKGFDLQADDFLSKPFNPDELVARIEAVRRRVNPASRYTANESLSIGDITIDFKRRHVLIKGKEVRLTRIEWLLLSELAHNAGRLILYEDLLSRVWGPEYRDDIQLLRSWVSRLRNKLGKESSQPDLIRTITKAGYIIEQQKASVSES